MKITVLLFVLFFSINSFSSQNPCAEVFELLSNGPHTFSVQTPEDPNYGTFRIERVLDDSEEIKMYEFNFTMAFEPVADYSPMFMVIPSVETGDTSTIEKYPNQCLLVIFESEDSGLEHVVSVVDGQLTINSEKSDPAILPTGTLVKK